MRSRLLCRRHCEAHLRGLESPPASRMLSFSDVEHRCRSALLTAAAVAAVWILLPQKALPWQGAGAQQDVPVVEGKVLSAAGTPIPGASLELVAENPDAQKEVVVAKAT